MNTQRKVSVILVLIMLLMIISPVQAYYWKVIRAINCGGNAVGHFEADNSYSGGGTWETTASITGGSAPEYVYQTERNGSNNDLTYTITGLKPGGFFQVILHFAEIYWDAANKRKFNVYLDGTRILYNYDIFAQAGGKNRGVYETRYQLCASGTLTILFEDTSYDMCKCSGIEILERTVDFADPDLEAVVEATLGISDPTPTEMLALPYNTLDADAQDIDDLTGLEYATDLTTLWLGENQISDISPLSGLTNLRRLTLNNNLISNISPLSGMTNLWLLRLHFNQISDISALSGLTKLEDLELKNNQISNVSPLSGLTNLNHLFLENNQISNVSPLSGLTNLMHLFLENNQISDISALSGLINLLGINLSNNQIRNISPLSGMSMLNSLSVEKNPLNSQAYCNILHNIYSHNPWINLYYDPSPYPPAGVTASDGTYDDKVEITWDVHCNGPIYDTYYRVYRSTSETGLKEPLSDWQTSEHYNDTSAVPGTTYYYWITAATDSSGDHETVNSSFDTGYAAGGVLTISSTTGGSVTEPGEGVFEYEAEMEVTVTAAPDPNYQFTGWTGTSVGAGMVTEVNVPNTTVIVDADYTLRAHFIPVDIVFVDIPAGTFEMGDHFDIGRPDESPVHTVTLDAFQLSQYETTNAQYTAYLNAALAEELIQVIDGVVYGASDVNQLEPYCHTYSVDVDSQIVYSQDQFTVLSRDGYSMADHPMLNVSWYGATAFCDYYGYYRLPTEAQWEYAARGGYHDPYYQYPWGSNSIDCNMANYKYDESTYCNPLVLSAVPYTTPIGYYGPQGAYGLCDMCGNVLEWCQDWYDEDYYSYSPVHNPTGPSEGDDDIVVIRGGAWNNTGYNCRIAARFAVRPDYCVNRCGFRMCGSQDMFLDPNQCVGPNLTSRPVCPTQCPVVETTCPLEQTQCPASPTSCPLVETECPLAETQCPPQLTTCPLIQTACTPDVICLTGLGQASGKGGSGEEKRCPIVDAECKTIP